MKGGDFEKCALRNPKFRNFLKERMDECVTVTIYAAFGFKNYAEKYALELLVKYNEMEKKT